MGKDFVKYKKEVFPIDTSLFNYLKKYNRGVQLPLEYEDLLRFRDGIPIYDENDEDTLWLSTFFPNEERTEIDLGLKKIYTILHVDGSEDVLPYLNVDSIDFCTYGNTKPFRVKVRNILNDNYVFFYIKKADASRVYGLELEHLLSPNPTNFLVTENTLVVDHISGIPGDVFSKSYLEKCSRFEKASIAKDFVKFNERCFVRLLGDMRDYNYVLVLMHDFDRIQYRFRAIDFDQQSYEGEMNAYFPHFYEENKVYQDLVDEYLSEGSIQQYKLEERSLMAKRATSEWVRLGDLLECMKNNTLSSEENINTLKTQLFNYVNDVEFKKSTSMGEIIQAAINFVVRNYKSINPYIIK
ncbi:MAG: hypothetical protein CL843_00780 [Crocinitomicaceae bacterium]|nr:hypothetical protein [Crocinitomicaceae bacterium]